MDGNLVKLMISGLEQAHCLHYTVGVEMDTTLAAHPWVVMPSGYDIRGTQITRFVQVARQAMGKVYDHPLIIVGREYSPVLYIEFPGPADDYEVLKQAWENGLADYAAETGADEFYIMQKSRGRGWCGIRLYWD